MIKTTLKKIKSFAFSNMRKTIRLLIVLWFASRVIYIYNAKHESYWGDEMYWLTNWIGLIGFSYLLREIILNPMSVKEEIEPIRRDLNKLGLMFVMYLIWEIVNCISEKVAYSDLTYGIMLFITALLISLVIIDKK